MSANKKIGIVITSKLSKTRTVHVIEKTYNSKYKKYLKKTKSYLVHDEENISKQGDIVIIKNTSPISKKKRWKIDTCYTDKI